jgi:Na+/melibiose symporter-like transporter
MDPRIVDVADLDELRNGRRREASFFGVNALITKPSESIAVLVLTSLLAFFSFVEPLIDPEGHAIPQPQPPEAIFGIRFLMSIFPAIILGLLLIALYFYPLDGPKYKEMKFKVQQMHEEKEKRLLEELRAAAASNDIEEEKGS